MYNYSLAISAKSSDKVSLTAQPGIALVVCVRHVTSEQLCFKRTGIIEHWIQFFEFIRARSNWEWPFPCPRQSLSMKLTYRPLCQHCSSSHSTVFVCFTPLSIHRVYITADHFLKHTVVFTMTKLTEP